MHRLAISTTAHLNKHFNFYVSIRSGQGTKNTRYDGRHLLNSQQGENHNPKHGRFKKVNDLTILLMFFFNSKIIFSLKNPYF